MHVVFTPSRETEHPETGFSGVPDPTSQRKMRQHGNTPRPLTLPEPTRKPSTTLPARMPSPITVAELRSAAGSKSHSPNIRYGLVVVSIWLSRQPKATVNANRRVASNMGTDIIHSKKSAEEIVTALFPDEPMLLMLRKAKAMASILEHRSLDENVVDFAVSHISSKCTCTEGHVAIAEEYADRLWAKKPSFTAFNNNADLWWPEFPTE